MTEQPTITRNTADTIAALMDAFADAENAAVICEALLRAGVQPDEKLAQAGLRASRYETFRTDGGTSALRWNMIAFADECDTAWDAVPEEIKDAVVFAWDFEFIPVCLRFRIEDGLYGSAWAAAVSAWVLQQVAEENARLVQQVLGRERAQADKLQQAVRARAGTVILLVA